VTDGGDGKGRPKRVWIRNALIKRPATGEGRMRTTEKRSAGKQTDGFIPNRRLKVYPGSLVLGKVKKGRGGANRGIRVDRGTSLLLRGHSQSSEKHGKKE